MIQFSTNLDTTPKTTREFEVLGICFKCCLFLNLEHLIILQENLCNTAVTSVYSMLSGMGDNFFVPVPQIGFNQPMITLLHKIN